MPRDTHLRGCGRGGDTRRLVGSAGTFGLPRTPCGGSSRRWTSDAAASLAYASAGTERGDVTVAIANASRALLEAPHVRQAARREWVLNEQNLISSAGLEAEASLLAKASGSRLATCIRELRGACSNADSAGPATTPS
jgi:hypothetical protein